MKKSYARNYLKIYLWQGMAMVLNIGSMAIVTPMLTSSQGLYGIYALCLSATVFLQYADIGFVGAAHKYASEAYARGDSRGEVRVIGFALFILLVFVGLYVLGVLACAWQPTLLIKNLHGAEEARTASRLLLILAAFSPVVVLQRFLQIVFGVRVEDYIFQRLSLLAGAIRIASVFWFFAPGRYDIVGYFLAYQGVNLALVAVSAAIARKRYGFDLGLLLRSIRYSREAFGLMKGLAFGSLYTTFLWVLFYEMDLFGIGRLLGPDRVAAYAVGFTLLGVIRGVFGTLFSPFSARFNHFRGAGHEAELKEFYLKVVVLTAPLVLFPLAGLASVARPFILSWVGPAYETAVPVTVLLLLSFAYSFLSYPASILMMAQEKVRELNVVSTLVVAAVWLGILLSFRHLGILAFAIAKFAGFTLYGAYYAHVTIRYLGFGAAGFARRVLGPLLAPLAVEVAALAWLAGYLPTSKGKANLFLAAGTGGAGALLALALYYFFSPLFQESVNALLKRLQPKAVAA